MLSLGGEGDDTWNAKLLPSLALLRWCRIVSVNSTDKTCGIAAHGLEIFSQTVKHDRVTMRAPLDKQARIAMLRDSNSKGGLTKVVQDFANPPLQILWS